MEEMQAAFLHLFGIPRNGGVFGVVGQGCICSAFHRVTPHLLRSLDGWDVEGRDTSIINVRTESGNVRQGG